MEAFNTRDVEALTGLSPYMVDYLCRAKIVVPSRMGSRGRGRGKSRRYSFGDVVLLRTYARLLKQGVSVKRLKEAHGTWTRHFQNLGTKSPPARYLFTDGKNVFLRQPEDIVAELNKNGQLAFGFIVDMQNVVDEVRKIATTITRKQ